MCAYIFLLPLVGYSFGSAVSDPLIAKNRMISHVEKFKSLEWKKINGVLLTELFLYILALAFQGFSFSSLCLFVVAGWLWSRRQSVPEGTKQLPGPWGKSS